MIVWHMQGFIWLYVPGFTIFTHKENLQIKWTCVSSRCVIFMWFEYNLQFMHTIVSIRNLTLYLDDKWN